MKFTSAAVALAAVLLPVAVAASADVHHPSEEAAKENPAVSTSTQQNLRRRANVFNNSANVDIIVVLKDEGRRRKLNGIGQATAAERMAAAEDNKAAAAAAAKSMGAVATLTYGSALYGFATNAPPGLLKKIEADPRVAYVETDGIVQLPPMEMGEDEGRRLAPPPGKGPNQDGGGGGDSGPAQTTPWGIIRVKGGSAYTGSGKAFVIDSGIDLDHPDLNVDTANSASFVRGGNADDQNGHGMYDSLLIYNMFCCGVNLIVQT